MNAPLALPARHIHLWWFADADSAPKARRERLDRRLREVLAGYCGLTPAQLRFEREPRGRPYLAGIAEPPDFNLSDTRGGSLVAVARGLRVGVDLERLDRRPSAKALAARYFSAEEAAAIAALDEDAARILFLQLWTAKEASCKATGTGIYGWLDAWRFVPGPQAPQLCGCPEHAGRPADWWHARVTPATGFTAVLAAAGSVDAVEWRRRG